MCLADRRGVVSMYSPNTSQPLVRMLCHKSAILSIAIQRDGNYMVTTGNDGLMKIWDLRTYKKLYDYWTPKQAKSLDLSQRNLLAVSNGNMLMVILLILFFFIILNRYGKIGFFKNKKAPT